MVILSLFDGMSCGQIALRELGVTIDKYYASEIDKFAIQNTMANFPDTVQLGDVRQVDAKSLGKIDLLIGGSPCQCFSFAGKRAGMSTKSKEQIETLTRYLELKQQGFELVVHPPISKIGVRPVTIKARTEEDAKYFNGILDKLSYESLERLTYGTDKVKL